MAYYVYLLVSKRNGTLYVGVTNDLGRRIWEHRAGVAEGFTKTHGIRHLVHFEVFDDPVSAIEREKKLKRWRREWKIALIERENPDWRDLYDEIIA